MKSAQDNCSNNCTLIADGCFGLFSDISATIIQTRRISSDVSLITLECKEIASTAKPGNFVNVKVNGATQPLLRRPFSIHDVRGSLIDLMVKSVGPGSALFCNTPEGSSVMVLGPLGNSFDVSSEKFQTAILVSGGIGAAPMLFLEKKLVSEGKRVFNLIGGRTQSDLLAHNLSNCRFATDDGSEGLKGTVVDLLCKELFDLQHDGTVKIFACGPNPMLKALAEFCRQHNVMCDISLESVMGCGIGICYGCSIEVKNPDDSIRTMLLCREGPVIDAKLFIK